MRRISIKLKVTIWYTVIITLLVVLMMTILLTISNRYMMTTAQMSINQMIDNSIDEISSNNGELEINSRRDYYIEGIYISIYDENARFLYGRVPNRFDNKVSLVEEKMRKISQEGTIWFVFDRIVSIQGYGEIWIRGIISESEVASALNYMIEQALFILPFMIILVALIGYYITKKAFKPVKQISEMAKRISVGNDLSQRISLGEGMERKSHSKDEIYQLADTFDSMLNRLQNSFENEKQFTSDASHELRTPISVIIAECEYLLENVETISEAKESLNIVLRQAKKMSGLVSQLLTLARNDNGNHKVNFERINLSELAEIITEGQRESAKEKEISIDTKIEEDVMLYADETMIMRVLVNLISNSIKYGRQGGHILIGIEMERKSYSMEEDIVIGFVKDDGIGIAKENLDKIWNRFYQVDPSRTSLSEKGMGLGLAMVQWIIQAHNGEIYVESVIDKGSIFTFKIPIK